jgi:hypothetical protein
MKTYLKLYSFLILAALLFNSCRNPAYQMNVLFDADVIQYKTTIILTDANGATLPNNVSVSVSGTDAKSIYDFSGTKQIFAPSGVITLGVTPKDVPTAAKTLSFNVLISAPGYENKNIPVTIAANQFSQILKVTMLKVAVATAVTTVVVKDTPISADGKVTTATTIATASSGTVAETATVTIPAGTQLKDAAGVILTGSFVTSRVINYEAKDPATINMFPGGSLSATNVIGADGKAAPTVFVPAGFTSIQMFVDGVEVRNFSTPINVSIQLDPAFTPAATGAPVKVGDQLPIYSYQTATGQFKFESMGTAALDANGKISMTFATNHLTIFVVGDALPAANCAPLKVKFIAPALTGNATEVMTIELSRPNGRILDQKDVIVFNGLVDLFAGLPQSAVKYRVIGKVSQKVYAEGAIPNTCAGEITVTLAGSGEAPAQNISLLLNVNCPGKGSITVPDFDIFFKPAGAPNGQYQLLGTVKKGLLVTSTLKIGTSYDFRVTWGNETKVVGNRTITALDMSAVVGENDFLGSKSPNYNKSLLIEACKLVK